MVLRHWGRKAPGDSRSGRLFGDSCKGKTHMGASSEAQYRASSTHMEKDITPMPKTRSNKKALLRTLAASAQDCHFLTYHNKKWSWQVQFGSSVRNRCVVAKVVYSLSGVQNKTPNTEIHQQLSPCAIPGVVFLCSFSLPYKKCLQTHTHTHTHTPARAHKQLSDARPAEEVVYLLSGVQKRH